MAVDFLIIGQGLSGTVLAQTIESKSLTYHIIDRNEKITSSKVAAGIMQPISFKRCILSWRGEEFFNFSNSFYLQSEKLFNTKSYKKLKLVRLFSSFEEQNNWMGKSTNPIYSPILGTENSYLKNICNDFGNSQVKTCAQLNVKKYIEDARHYFLSKGRLSNEEFKESNLEYNGELFTYKGITSKRIIMCQGVNSQNNKIFDYLPIIPNKGELIDISTNKLPNFMLSKGVFTVPIKENKFRLGSTYNHKDIIAKTTLKAKNELLNGLNKITPIKGLNILEHKFGFRPTTIDRKPTIGAHPEIKNMYIFNGMGSKGVLMAPLLSKELLEHILRRSEINSDVNVNRFFKKYSLEHSNYAKNLLNF